MGGMENKFIRRNDNQHYGGDGMDAIKLAIMFHNLYEQYAPEYGYKTNEETRIFNASTPNGKLMIRVCREIQKIVTIK